MTDAKFMDSLTGDLEDHIQQPHNKKVYGEIQKLKAFIQEFVQYQIDHPEIASMSTWDERDLSALKETAEDKEVRVTMSRMSRKIKAQAALIKPLHRNSVMKVREEKAQTAESRSVNDALILQTSNLKYEEQILRSEIAASQNFPHVHKTLPVVSKEELFAHPNFESFNITDESSDYDIMAARIELEYQNRVKMEEARQEKLKQKQQLIAELKKRKEKLTNLDAMLEDFVDKAEPIQTVLDNE
ncbi:hypothetical protein P154DRAFT_87591 [Amniculicola lignicola CBS 123094]|uniref:Uncharacterized protein n=1 Tax=Amniculicola lignicola CBS 123094 TaxID=1392246 RepID=A0A6A5WNC2_9PLEO|nr:hypothetical protein P154DRAFT_87591 [Amniculicola lignicola CBS 123094]